MRHKYETRGIVLARTPLGEAATLLTIVVPHFGLVRARAQGLRKSGAKLAHALTTFTETEVVLVRGKEGWRLAGAVSVESWFAQLAETGARERAGRIVGLVCRLVIGESTDSALYEIIRGCFEAFAHTIQELHEAVELLTVLRILSALGLEVGSVPPDAAAYTPEHLTYVAENRHEYIARINRGISASGL